jgi:hypothetical protein
VVVESLWLWRVCGCGEFVVVEEWANCDIVGCGCRAVSWGC